MNHNLPKMIDSIEKKGYCIALYVVSLLCTCSKILKSKRKYEIREGRKETKADESVHHLLIGKKKIVKMCIKIEKTRIFTRFLLTTKYWHAILRKESFHHLVNDIVYSM